MSDGEGWSREACIAALERAAEELGPGFTLAEYRSLIGVPSKPVLARTFGSFSEAKEAVGLETNWPEQYSDEDCLEAIRRVADELGHAPSQSEYIEATARMDIPTQPIVWKRFGSFPVARERALEDESDG